MILNEPANLPQSMMRIVEAYSLSLNESDLSDRELNCLIRSIPFEIMDALLPQIIPARRELAATHMVNYIVKYMDGDCGRMTAINVLNSLSVDMLDRLFSKTISTPGSLVPKYILSSAKVAEVLKRRTMNELADVMCGVVRGSYEQSVFEKAINSFSGTRKLLIKEFFWRASKIRMVETVNYITDDEVLSELILESSELSDRTIYYTLIKACLGRPRERTVLRPVLQKIIERGGFKPNRAEVKIELAMDIETLQLLLSMGETGVRFSPTYLKLGVITTPKPAEQIQVKDVSKWLLESSENWQKLSEVVEIAHETILC